MQIPHNLSRRGMGVVTFWLTAIIAVVIDQVTKAAIRHLLPVGSPPQVLIPGVINLLRVENTGAAFSIGEGATWLFVACAVAAFVVGCLLVWTNDLPFPLALSLGAVAGGGVGNMIDRLASGSVTDFIATTFIDFPVFNVADIFVTCGVIVSMVLYLRWEATEGRADRPAETDGQPHA